MRKLILLIAVAVGCGGSTQDTDTILSGVQVIDRDYLEQGQWFMDLSVSEAPVQLSEVTDDAAYEIELLVAYDFVAAVANRQVIAAWPIEDVAGESALPTVPDRFIIDWRNRGLELSSQDLEQLQTLHPGLDIEDDDSGTRRAGSSMTFAD